MHRTFRARGSRQVLEEVRDVRARLCGDRSGHCCVSRKRRMTGCGIPRRGGRSSWCKRLRRHWSARFMKARNWLRCRHAGGPRRRSTNARRAIAIAPGRSLLNNSSLPRFRKILRQVIRRCISSFRLVSKALCLGQPRSLWNTLCFRGPRRVLDHSVSICT